MSSRGRGKDIQASKVAREERSNGVKKRDVKANNSEVNSKDGSVVSERSSLSDRLKPEIIFPSDSDEEPAEEINEAKEANTPVDAVNPEEKEDFDMVMENLRCGVWKDFHHSTDSMFVECKRKSFIPLGLIVRVWDVSENVTAPFVYEICAAATKKGVPGINLKETKLDVPASNVWQLQSGDVTVVLSTHGCVSDLVDGLGLHSEATEAKPASTLEARLPL